VERVALPACAVIFGGPGTTGLSQGDQFACARGEDLESRGVASARPKTGVAAPRPEFGPTVALADHDSICDHDRQNRHL